LLNIRDKLLRLQLIAIQLDSEDDAYLIFETLNTRGKDLEVSDLVKNHITRQLRPKNKGLDTAKDRWNELSEILDSSEAELDIDRFIHHAWLSRHEYVSSKILFKQIKHTVTQSQAKLFLDSLLIDANIYRRILDPATAKWDKQERSVREALGALNMFRVVQPVPMLLSIMRSHSVGTMSLGQVIDILRIMEDFHVQFTAITAQRTGGGTAQMYALGARELSACQSKDESAQVLKSFKMKMRDRVPSVEEFEAGWLELRFSNENTKQRQLVRYLLRRLDQHFRSGDVPDYDQMTIEHIAPQHPIGTPKLQSDMVSWFGNLVLVPDAVNQELKNRAPEEKISLLVQKGYPMDPFLASVSEWDESAIRNRTTSLARLFLDDILKV
jgi:hypothetical protein